MSDGFLKLAEVEVSPATLANRIEAPERIPPFPAELPASPNLPKWPVREFARPDYAERFTCIGGACEDTCCQGWGVPIDQATYEKYRSHPVLKPHIGTLIVLNTQAPTRTDFARLPLRNDGSCGFLDEQRLCSIQRQLGAEMLSETCATYPRAVSTHAGEIERALNLSCPEAARLTLTDPYLLNGAGRLNQATAHYDGVREWTTPALQPQEAGLAVRQFALMLLTDRRYPLWQRVYLLGILARRLEVLIGDVEAGAWCEEHPAEVEAILLDSARAASTGVVRAAMDELNGDTAQQLQFVAEILRLRFAGPPIPPRFIECLRAFEAGLGCNTSNEAGILADYAESYEVFYGPLMEQHPYLLENFLVNHIFKNNFPFGRKADDTTPEAEHLALVVHLATAQALLVGMARHYGGALGLDHAVKLVQSLAKTTEHGKAYLEQVAALAAAKGYNTMRGVAVLLRQDGA